MNTRPRQRYIVYETPLRPLHFPIILIVHKRMYSAYLAISSAHVTSGSGHFMRSVLMAALYRPQYRIIRTHRMPSSLVIRGSMIPFVLHDGYIIMYGGLQYL